METLGATCGRATGRSSTDVLRAAIARPTGSVCLLRPLPAAVAAARAKGGKSWYVTEVLVELALGNVYVMILRHTF